MCSFMGELTRALESDTITSLSLLEILQMKHLLPLFSSHVVSNMK